jgi:hypothetical protein
MGGFQNGQRTFAPPSFARNPYFPGFGKATTLSSRMSS